MVAQRKQYPAILLLVGLVTVPFPASRIQSLETAQQELNATVAILAAVVRSLSGCIVEGWVVAAR